jgi:hypothetical protein
VRKIVVRLVLLVAGFAISGIVLTRAFDGFDADAVWSTIGGLTWADIARLTLALLALLVAEAFLSASFVPGLTMWHGAIAWLASNAVASVVPGPSDMPLRYRMFRSWGLRASDAATATAGATVLNVASKMVLPAVAAIGLAVGRVEVGSVRILVITGCAVFAAVALVVAVAFGTEASTATFGRLVSKVVRRPVEERVVHYRNNAFELVGRTWKRNLIGITLVSASYVVLFVWCMRAVGIEAASVSWLALFCVWALVRGITVLPTMPGDAGVSELAFVSLLTEVAGSGSINAVTAGVVLYRAITWIALIPIGLVAIAIWRLTLPKAPAGPLP